MSQDTWGWYSDSLDIRVLQATSLFCISLRCNYHQPWIKTHFWSHSHFTPHNLLQ